MTDHQNHSSGQYTCNEYRAEMILLALHNKLRQENLDDVERWKILQEIALQEIANLEKKIGLA